MLKGLKKFLYLTGDVGYVGIGATIIYCGAGIMKWAFDEMKTDLKH